MQNNKEKEFIEKLQKIYPNEFEKVITGLNFTPKTFRVNTLTSNQSDVIKKLEEAGYVIQQSKLGGGFICDEKLSGKILSYSNENINHEIYIQELSSMIPAKILLANSKLQISNDQFSMKNDKYKILDMCASPGSKTTQIAAITNNKANIVALEKSTGRFLKLKKIISDYGAKAEVIKIDANRFPSMNSANLNSFDYILLDAPCSNEASLDLSEPSSFKMWSRKNAKNISKLQKGLINSAWKLLKPGGTLVYSTCTFSVEENEMVVDWLLKRQVDAKIEQINLGLDNVVEGRIQYEAREFDPQISKTKRILPNNNFKGFYVAKLLKIA